MNYFQYWFPIYWLYTIPNFVIILFAKCADVVLYKKLRMTDKTAKLLFLNFFIIEAAHVLAVGIEILSLHWGALLILIPIFTVLPLITLHFIERKFINHRLGTPTSPKRIVTTNIVLALLFDLSYGCFIRWFFASNEPWLCTLKPKYILLIGIFALVISFAIIKVVIQTRILKKKSDDSLSQSIENPAK
ncbi:MAG: hypothetical protein IJ292_00110 [Clostridia bacterium]|nr:hypothetical protein [Clostridia bacterium]